MVTSNWIVGLRMLLAQSVGLASTRSDEPGVIARMMPRVLLTANDSGLYIGSELLWRGLLRVMWRCVSASARPLTPTLISRCSRACISNFPGPIG